MHTSPSRRRSEGPSSSRSLLVVREEEAIIRSRKQGRLAIGSRKTSDETKSRVLAQPRMRSGTPGVVASDVHRRPVAEC